MRARAAAVLLLAAAACGRGPAAGPACPHDLSLERSPEFRVLVSSVPTAVRRDLDFAGLSRLAGVETVGGKLEGLTVVDYRLAVRTDLELSRSRAGPQSCAWLKSLTVDLTPASIVIYVPRDYAPDSCESEEILAHERRHEEIHRRLLDEAAESVRRALSKFDRLPARGTPLAVSDRAEAGRRIDALVDGAVKPVYDDFQRELAKEQAVLDTPENYRWTSLRCPRWK